MGENNSFEYDYSKLKGKIVEAGLNNKKFASLLNISTTTFYNILNSKSYFNQPQIEKAKIILSLTDFEINAIFFTQKVKKN